MRIFKYRERVVLLILLVLSIGIDLWTGEGLAAMVWGIGTGWLLIDVVEYRRWYSKVVIAGLVADSILWPVTTAFRLIFSQRNF